MNGSSRVCRGLTSALLLTVTGVVGIGCCGAGGGAAAVDPPGEARLEQRPDGTCWFVPAAGEAAAVVCQPHPVADAPGAGGQPGWIYVSGFTARLRGDDCATYAAFWCDPGACQLPAAELAPCSDHRGIIIED